MRFPTKPLTAEEETLRLRERALRDEVSLLKQAKREGLAEGEQVGIQKGRVEGRVEAKRETALNLIKRTDMDDAMIADIAGLTLSEVTELRSETKH